MLHLNKYIPVDTKCINRDCTLSAHLLILYRFLSYLWDLCLVTVPKKSHSHLQRLPLKSSITAPSDKANTCHENLDGEMAGPPGSKGYIINTKSRWQLVTRSTPEIDIGLTGLTSSLKSWTVKWSALVASLWITGGQSRGWRADCYSEGPGQAGERD